MKKPLLILIGLVALLAAGYVIFRGVPTRVRSTSEKFDLSAEQLTDLTKRAKEHGDAEAAFRVYEYYDYSSTDRNSESNVIYYLRIAATNGNAVAQYNLAVRLVVDRDPAKYEDAKFWLEKAAAAGNGDAKKGLQDWDHFVSQWH
jgi:TPR repeat protein